MRDTIRKANIALTYSQVQSPSNPEAQRIAAQYLLRSYDQVPADKPARNQEVK